VFLEKARRKLYHDGIRLAVSSFLHNRDVSIDIARLVEFAIRAFTAATILRLNRNDMIVAFLSWSRVDEIEPLRRSY
jgi:hypothetical protein